MRCRKCQTSLTTVTDKQCPHCHTPFDPADPESFLPAQDPERLTIARVVRDIIITTVLAVCAAYVVSIHQLMRHSGH